MRHIRRAAVGGLFALWLAPLSAEAASQSSNSSSNCSNGRCTRVESLVIEDDRGRRGWVRHEAWQEQDLRRGRARRSFGPAPRGRDADDDDD